jgi:hypothetical protein
VIAKPPTTLSAVAVAELVHACIEGAAARAAAAAAL